MPTPVPTAEAIITLRWRVRTVFRVLAVLLLVLAIVIAIPRISQFRTTQTWAAGGFAQPPDPTGWAWFGPSIAGAATAVALLVVSQFAVRLLVPIPRPNCPKCGYDLSEPTSNVCPECGLRIADDQANHPS